MQVLLFLMFTITLFITLFFIDMSGQEMTKTAGIHEDVSHDNSRINIRMANDYFHDIVVHPCLGAHSCSHSGEY